MNVEPKRDGYAPIPELDAQLIKCYLRAEEELTEACALVDGHEPMPEASRRRYTGAGVAMVLHMVRVLRLAAENPGHGVVMGLIPLVDAGYALAGAPPRATHQSAQPCGCDPGANWTCEWHRASAPVETSADPA